MTLVKDDEELEDEFDDIDGEVSLEELEEDEEEENAGHKVHTFAPDTDGMDDYFDEKYFDE